MLNSFLIAVLMGIVSVNFAFAGEGKSNECKRKRPGEVTISII
jgi:hypothetical protein